MCSDAWHYSVGHTVVPPVDVSLAPPVDVSVVPPVDVSVVHLVAAFVEIVGSQQDQSYCLV